MKLSSKPPWITLTGLIALAGGVFYLVSADTPADTAPVDGAVTTERVARFGPRSTPISIAPVVSCEA